MVKKAFNELTEQGQKKRLAKYEQERAARGTTEALVRLVKPATIKTIKDDNKMAILRFAEYNKETQETKFFTANAFIEKGKEKLEAFYAGLTKGQLLSLEYKVNNGYTNVYNLMDRSYADTRRKQQSASPQSEQPTGTTLESDAEGDYEL